MDKPEFVTSPVWKLTTRWLRTMKEDLHGEIAEEEDDLSTHRIQGKLALISQIEKLPELLFDGGLIDTMEDSDAS